MKLKKQVLSLLVLGGLSVSGASFAGDMATGQDLANTCAGCHGTHGNSMGPATPSLAGISEEYFVDAMKNYKSDKSRTATVMSRIAKGYSDAEIEAMAGIFAKEKVVNQKQDFDPKLAAEGAKLHKKYCEKCHEDGGKSADEAHVLAGQWMDYLQFTMTDFDNGSRDMPKKMKKRMEKVKAKAGDEGYKQLIHYYGSQQ